MRVWAIHNERGEFVRFKEDAVLDLAYLADGQVARVVDIPGEHGRVKFAFQDQTELRREVGAGVHRERLVDATPAEDSETCERCSRDYAVWFAPSELWNAVMRDGVRANPDRMAFVCPTCFAIEAESAGLVPTAWVLHEEQADYPAACPSAPRAAKAAAC